MKTYLKILSRLYNTPLAISQDKLDVISNNVTIKLLSGESLEDGGFAPINKDVEATESVAIIKVFDSLVSKGGAGASGFTSYESIQGQVMSAIAAGASKIGFYIDSPGGEVSGLFGLTSFIATIPANHGVETFAYSDGMMTSAAYAIGSATQKIYTSANAMSGSIAVIMDLVNVAKLDAKEGIEHFILRSKSEKALGNPHEEMTDEILNKYTAILDSMDVLFNNEVVRNRPNLSVENIKSMKGNTFIASEALDLGLIDSIVSNIDEVITLETTKITSTTLEGTTMTMTLEQAKAKITALEADLDVVKAAATNAAAQAITGERTRCLEILKAGETLKISGEATLKRLSAGTSQDDALDIFTAIAEATGNATAVDTSTEVTTTLSDNVVPIGAKFEVGGVEATASEIVAAAKAQGDK